MHQGSNKGGGEKWVDDDVFGRCGRQDLLNETGLLRDREESKMTLGVLAWAAGRMELQFTEVRKDRRRSRFRGRLRSGLFSWRTLRYPRRVIQ